MQSDFDPCMFICVVYADDTIFARVIKEAIQAEIISLGTH